MLVFLTYMAGFDVLRSGYALFYLISLWVLSLWTGLFLGIFLLLKLPPPLLFFIFPFSFRPMGIKIFKYKRLKQYIK